MRPTVGTIVAKNGMALARALASSLARHHPELRLHVLLADEVQGFFDPDSEPFELVSFDELAIAHGERLRFRYPRLELSRALIPWFLEHLLRLGHDRVLFIKEESLVVGDLGPLLARLEQAPILLTPHYLAPLGGGAGADREREVLRAGVYNTGVIGVSSEASAWRFLAWWRERLWRHCRLAVGEGMHYDQRWLDFVPSLFPGVAIERDPGANVGHWNLPERTVEWRAGEIWVDGGPARVFRFSGFDPERPGSFTRHNDRLEQLEGVEAKAARAALRLYAEAIAAAGHDGCIDWPYAWSTYGDGAPIPPGARDVYRELGEDEVERFGDPFEVDGPASFRVWLDASDDDEGSHEPPRRLSRLWRSIHSLRPDLQRAFPDPRGADRSAFLTWIARHGAEEHGAPNLRR